MQNLFYEMEQLLRQKHELFSQDGSLLRNLVIEKGLKLDPSLLDLLLTHDRIKQHFFTQVGDILVFDKEKFLQFVNNKEFLPDSYTTFKNKIGLSDDSGKTLISQKQEVSLVWPYKDCVLEGGQTKEDANRDEIFWNTTLAPDDISRLLEPKVLTNWKIISNQGKHKINKICENQNFLIKGNNLLALASLQRVFTGKIKLIYIDPPYNTGNDDFGYNDLFNHSSWLTFMKNRLNVAKDLLTDDGSIWINIDDDEAHYLKVLCDEIFDRDNFVRNVVWQKRTSPDTRATIGDGHDHILVYAKNIDKFKEVANRIPKTEEQKSRFSNPDNDPRGPWVSSDFTAQGYRPNQMYTITTPGGVEYSPPEGRCWKNIESVFQKLVEENRMWFGQDGCGVPRRKTYLSEAQDIAVWSWWSNDEVGHNQEAKKESIALFGADNPFSTPKPERLLKRIIQVGSEEGELILDFFAGSGTTAAVAHKMGRRYISIEQMDYIEEYVVERMRKVIGTEVKKNNKLLPELDYDQGGISESVGWLGGGNFVYFELMQWNEYYVRKIDDANNKDELLIIWHEIQNKAHLSYQVEIKSINENAKEFKDLSLKNQKRFLLEILDKNSLYVNYSEIDDVEYGVSEEDKHLNHLFYGTDV